MGCCFGKTALPDQFSKELMREHNTVRRLHGSSPLSWSDDNARVAQQWADHLASTGRMEYGPRDVLKQRNLGQNLFVFSDGTPSAREVADTWYEQKNNYNFSQPGLSTRTTHFTQMVWVATKRIGVGTASKGLATYVVANYSPAGNMPGHFDENVKPASR